MPILKTRASAALQESTALHGYDRGRTTGWALSTCLMGQLHLCISGWRTQECQTAASVSKDGHHLFLTPLSIHALCPIEAFPFLWLQLGNVTALVKENVAEGMFLKSWDRLEITNRFSFLLLGTLFHRMLSQKADEKAHLAAQRGHPAHTGGVSEASRQLNKYPVIRRTFWDAAAQLRSPGDYRPNKVGPHPGAHSTH